ncbi:methionine synthase [Chloroflexota bacterium]
MPHINPVEACRLITHYLKDIPAWPQLPKRSLKESMYVQYSEGFPGVIIEGDMPRVNRTTDIDKFLEKLYAAYLENDYAKYPTSKEYASGLHQFLSLDNLAPKAVKGQVVGPVTWAATVTDNSEKAIIWDDTLSDAVARFLRLKAAWQEKQLKQLCKNTIIFLDEPYMENYGSRNLIALSKEKVITLIDEVFGGISGLKGIHCCGNTDWPVLLSTGLNILSLDAYAYAQTLSLYPVEVKAFLQRGGAIAWGIIPNTEELLVKETVASLKDRFEAALEPFTGKGIPFKQLLEQSLLTPGCGLAGLATVEAAEKVLQMLVELSSKIRSKHL